MMRYDNFLKVIKTEKHAAKGLIGSFRFPNLIVDPVPASHPFYLSVYPLIFFVSVSSTSKKASYFDPF
ncbi:hypothetical protein RJT34_10907 [Clitoria ternatea]|uniref:Uncharacterized protein n=1 Tax=Clitoria ternatea TaxID=43366 RepID=A0AAN9JIX7_CLITE